MVKAVVVSAPGEVPAVQEVSRPEMTDDEVRVRIAAAGVCHSDLSLINGTLAPAFPLLLGHEASGVVTEVGPSVSGVNAGDRVVLNWAAPCRKCWFCTHEQPWLCSEVEGVVSTPGGWLDDGTQVHNCLGMGAFAEDVVVPASAVVALPDGVPLDLAALLGCAVLTGVGAVRNTARVKSGDTVLVVGLGGIGLSAVLGAKLAGAPKIIAVDLNADKEVLARAAGATDFLVSEPGLAKRVRALTDGRGVDHSFECVGAAETIRLAWSCARRGGACTVVGVGSREQHVTFNALELFHFARSLSASIYGSSDPERDIPELSEHILAGNLELGTLVTHRIGLEQVPEAFARMEAGEGARSLIVMEP
jgi:S-(hydroxymethyl)glutathione dehydrogenase / alcohol dehydrogenase